MRREEVAVLAGVSTDYYTRLEQGRERRPSEQVLTAIADALRLDRDGEAHLRALSRPVHRGFQWSEVVSDNLLRLMENWPATPAMVLGRGLYMLAANRLTRLLFSPMQPGDSLVRFVFLTPASRTFYVDWEKVARNGVAAVRAATGSDPGDPKIAGLVDELTQESADFRRIWARHDVKVKTGDVKRFRHPEVGELTLTYETFSVNSAPGQQLLVYQADPGSASERALRLLDDLDGPAKVS
jgi:transcriptional regulator with XRE-family HTH domain